MQLKGRLLVIAAGLLTSLSPMKPVAGGVLPDDRADVLYHRYDGGGVTIDGPSVLVRKGFRDKVSVSANYYVDMVSSASIDVQVISGASRYEEQRDQASLSVDYLRGKSTYSAGFINSDESDYEARSAFFSISQDFFGDLTTVTMTFKRGWDDVFRNVKQAGGALERDPGFAEQIDRRGYALGLTQILTRSTILNLSYEVLTDEGYLNSPYRRVRYVDPTSERGFTLEDERYPNTRTSNAISARIKQFLPYRAALEGQYRFFTDTWGIDAHTLELAYTHPWRQQWIFDGKARLYRQNAADFYRDLFPRRDFANFLARDKELSTFQGYTLGVGATYQFKMPRAPWIQKSTANLRYDHLILDYENFRDARVTNPANGINPGTEPLYELNADVIQLFLSIWF